MREIRSICVMVKIEIQINKVRLMRTLIESHLGKCSGVVVGDLLNWPV